MRIKKNNLKMAGFMMVLVVVVGSIIFFTGRPGQVPDEFAKCLTEKGAVMYGTYWCSHCKAQKREFGDAFQFVNYVECTDQAELCTEKEVEGFPTWIIDGTKYTGQQSLNTLSLLTGCEL
ncbi:TPA: hypothetical protein HA265_01385 [Candidatus Woesearchaeota archaeon]|nr:hypothetical protein [Candidatus Woesearchaeota archaeon]